MASPLEPGWRRLPGRRFLNTITGEEISRRQYDQRYGRLRELGAGGIEKQNKRNRELAEEGLRRLGPARGRAKSGYTPRDASRIRPLRGKVARRVGSGRTAAAYDSTLSQLRRNRRISGIAPLAVFSVDGAERFIWLQPMTFPAEVIDGLTACESIGVSPDGEAYSADDEDYDETEVSDLPLGQRGSLSAEFFSHFAFHVHFTEETFVPAPKKPKTKSNSRKLPGPKRKK